MAAIDQPDDRDRRAPGRLTRRRVLAAGIGGAAVLLTAGAVGLELVSHDVLPGKQELDKLEGACNVAVPPARFANQGFSRSGTFSSVARGREVGYTVAWPPGHPPGTALPLVLMLHGFGGNHASALAAMSPAQALALEVDGDPLPPMAMVTADGGGGYWNPHPGDDPLDMLVSEVIPMCQALGLGQQPERIGAMGISMGGYGALLLAEKHPDLISAVAAISPAIWTSYGEARAANPGAYASEQHFVAADAVTHTHSLGSTPVRIASGADDPFHAGVVALARSLPASADVQFPTGCHTDAFFAAQEPPSLQFLGRHLSR